MLYPSIDTLIRLADSKYSIVIMASKRGRQLLDRERLRSREQGSFLCSPKYIGMALEEIANSSLIVQT